MINVRIFFFFSFERKVGVKRTGMNLKEKTFCVMKGTFTNGEVACVELCFVVPERTGGQEARVARSSCHFHGGMTSVQPLAV